MYYLFDKNKKVISWCACKDKLQAKDNEIIIEYNGNIAYYNLTLDKDNNPISITLPPVPEAVLKAQKIKSLSANFEKQKDTITAAYMSAALANNQNAMAAMQTSYKKLMADYHKALQTIQ